MELVVIIFLMLVVVLFITGDVSLNEKRVKGIRKLYVCIIGRFMLALLIGIPILGILHLVWYITN